MSFINFFRNQIPEILIRFKSARLECSRVQHDIERLVILEQNLASGKTSESRYNELIMQAINSFGVALWAKDRMGRFIFANKVCCTTILKCRENEVLTLAEADFEKDAMSAICLKSDRLVMRNERTMRFIEHAYYSDTNSNIFIDTVKTPRIDATGVIGIIGSGVIITNSIPLEIREKYKNPGSIEISLNAAMSTAKLVEILKKSGGEKNENRSKE